MILVMTMLSKRRDVSTLVYAYTDDVSSDTDDFSSDEYIIDDEYITDHHGDPSQYEYLIAH